MQLQRVGLILIIVDEATHYKNVQTKRWKTLNKLINNRHLALDDDRYTCGTESNRCVWYS